MHKTENRHDAVLCSVKMAEDAIKISVCGIIAVIGAPQGPRDRTRTLPSKL